MASSEKVSLLKKDSKFDKEISAIKFNTLVCILWLLFNLFFIFALENIEKDGNMNSRVYRFDIPICAVCYGIQFIHGITILVIFKYEWFESVLAFLLCFLPINIISLITVPNVMVSWMF